MFIVPMGESLAGKIFVFSWTAKRCTSSIRALDMERFPGGPLQKQADYDFPIFDTAIHESTNMMEDHIDHLLHNHHI